MDVVDFLSSVLVPKNANSIVTAITPDMYATWCTKILCCKGGVIITSYLRHLKVQVYTKVSKMYMNMLGGAYMRICICGLLLYFAQLY